MGTGLQGVDIHPDRHETVIYPTRLSRTVVRITDILRGGFTGQEVTGRGWIYRTRSGGGKAFVVLRDSTGILQVTVSKESVPTDHFDAAERALIESSATARGTVVQDKRAPGGAEGRAAGSSCATCAPSGCAPSGGRRSFACGTRGWAPPTSPAVATDSGRSTRR